MWGKAKDLVEGKVAAKVVDEIWTYLSRILRPFTSGSLLVSFILPSAFTFHSQLGMGMRRPSRKFCNMLQRVEGG